VVAPGQAAFHLKPPLPVHFFAFALPSDHGFEAAMKERNLVAFSVICLPDTVDPRGPKGK